MNETTNEQEVLLLRRKLDLLLRTGKLLMESAADTNRIERNMKRVAAYLGIPEEKLRMDMKEHQVTMAVGMIWKEHGPKDIDLLLNESERLMYEDKDRYYKEHGLKRRR
jgi:ATP-dependent Lon protease